MRLVSFCTGYICIGLFLLACFKVAGFTNVGVNASKEVRFTGTGVTEVVATNTTLNSGRVVAATASDQLFKTTGALAVTGGSNTASSVDLGGKLALQGNEVNVSGRIIAPAGSLALSATGAGKNVTAQAVNPLEEFGVSGCIVGGHETLRTSATRVGTMVQQPGRRLSLPPVQCIDQRRRAFRALRVDVCAIRDVLFKASNASLPGMLPDCFHIGWRAPSRHCKTDTQPENTGAHWPTPASMAAVSACREAMAKGVLPAWFRRMASAPAVSNKRTISV